MNRTGEPLVGRLSRFASSAILVLAFLASPLPADTELEGMTCHKDPASPYVRVVFRFSPSVFGKPEFRSTLDPTVLLPAWVSFGIALDGRMEPVFSSRLDVLDPVRSEARHGFVPSGPNADLLLYFQAFTPNLEDALKLQKNLTRDDVGSDGLPGHGIPVAAWADVELAVRAETLKSSGFVAPTSGVCTPDLGPQGDTGDLSSCQAYLAPATTSLRSLDAAYAWQYLGGRGEGVRLALIDEGIDLQHEDFPTINNLSTVRVRSHGNASLGTCCAVSGNDLALEGIAGKVDVAFAHPWDASTNHWNTADTISKAAKWLKRGDVILLELNSDRCENGRYGGLVPMETFDDVRRAIELASKDGIYVVEAAGNGMRNLNLVPGLPANGSAILVGAATSAGQVNTAFNYGARVDVQGWDSGVTSAGSQVPPYYSLRYRSDSHRCYLNDFAGTSSATAMVGGVVASLSGIIKASGLPPLDPAAMTGLLKAGCLTPPMGATTCQPNLRKALEWYALTHNLLVR